MNFEVPEQLREEMNAICKSKQISKTRLFRDAIALYSMVYMLKQNKLEAIELKTILL